VHASLIALRYGIKAAKYVYRLYFLLAINVQTKTIGQKSVCSLTVGVQHSKNYTITAHLAKVKFNAQKGHEWMTVTFSEVVLYGNDVW